MLNKRSNNGGKRIFKISKLLIYILIVSCLALSITIARYQTTLNQVASVDTAKWIFKLSYNNTQVTTAEYNIDLKDTITTVSENVASDYIAPGTAGQIPLQIDCTDCEVGVQYSLKITDPTSTLPGQLKFYTSSDYSDASLITLGTIYTDNISLEQINTIQNKTIYWKWIATDDNTINQQDLAKSGTAMTINIIISGQEKIDN